MGLGLACALGGGWVSAQTWRFEPGVYVQETLTNNVNLAPSDSTKSDAVTEIAPFFRVTEKSAHTSLVGSVAIQGLLSARTGEQNNRIYPLVNLLGTETRSRR